MASPSVASHDRSRFGATDDDATHQLAVMDAIRRPSTVRVSSPWKSGIAARLQRETTFLPWPRALGIRRTCTLASSLDSSSDRTFVA